MTEFAELAHAAARAELARPGVPLALATLIGVEGSSYRQPGARLLVDAEARVLAGAVSGGCLEGDVASRAAEVCRSGSAILLTYDLRKDLETIWGFGAACDGVAHLLLEPLSDWHWLTHAEAIGRSRTPGALAVVWGEDRGCTFALLEGTPRSGRWLSVAQTSPHEAARWAPLLSSAALMELVDTVQQTGRSTSGQLHGVEHGIAALVEPLTAPVALHIVGAGRGAAALAGIAHTMGWSVTILDHRPALLDALTVPPEVQRVPVRGLGGVDDALERLPQDARTAVALMTHVFDIDAAWLTAVLPTDIAYVGVLGSRARGGQLLEHADTELAARGVARTERFRHKVYAPIGLDLGGEDPASIALSAIAEIEAVLHARPAGFLRERQSPIHSRTPTPTVHR